MKPLHLFILLWLPVTLYAQKPELKSITTSDRILHGKINDEYPITLYLKVVRRSGNIGWVLSVAGWYQYDRVGTSIPLVGIWNGRELHLCASENPQLMENMENFAVETTDGIKYLDNRMHTPEDIMKNTPAIKERFHLQFDEKGFSGTWYSEDKALPAAIKTNDSDILNTLHYLKLSDGSTFDLSNLGPPDRTVYEVVAHANNGRNLLIDYSYLANLNYMGRCGAGENSGKIALAFDENYRLSGYQVVEFENCYAEWTIDNIAKVSDTVSEYRIVNYNGDKDQTYIVDTASATIARK